MNGPYHKVYFSLMEGTGGTPRVPTKAHPSDAGWDLWASQDVVVDAGASVNVPTGLCIAMPEGWCAIIRPRSSTLSRHGLVVIEGVIDHGYRGEMFYTVYNPPNTERETALIRTGDRLAQLLFLPVPQVEWVGLKWLPETSRGAMGFGSSGR